MAKIKIVVVVDNTPGGLGCLAEHGLSLWVECDGRCLLYDTGAGKALLPNLEALELDPRRLECVVLSHGHYDHVGGLAGLLKARAAEGLKTPVWCHPAVFHPHLKEALGQVSDLGPPHGRLEDYQGLGAEFHWVEGNAAPLPGVILLAPIARRTEFEGAQPGLVTKEGGGLTPDPFLDDLALVLENDGEPLVLTGCAHAGVVNILLAVEEALGRRPHALIGGTHLGPAPEAQRMAVLAELEARPELQVVAGHCTGREVMGHLARRLGLRFKPLCVGQVMEI
ncbi:hypothetical protein AAU61_04230 [Desulfocarbo indianensis]|nr:hypothetical protein AAU61_04230 [Desulfocarbo indianensis]